MNFLIAGDLCPRGDAEKLNAPETASEITCELHDEIQKYNLSMVNIETVFSEEGEPIPKSGPNIKSEMQSMNFVTGFGFDIGACANNHMGDYGAKGLLGTLENLKNIGMKTVGAGINDTEAQKPLYIDKCGIKLAVINCAEHEFGIAEKDKPGMAGMDYRITSQIIKRTKENADKVILFMHGGNEFNPLPRPGMRKICRTFAEAGADAIVLSHSHCPQGSEMIGNVPVFYGTGNFYMSSTKKSTMWEYGYMVNLNIEKEKAVTAEIIPYHQNFDGTKITLLKGGDKDRFMKYFDCISKLMHDDETYLKMTLAWAKRYMEEIADFEERTDKSPQSEQTLFIRNSYTCESHNELMTLFYKAYCENGLSGLEKYDCYITKLQNYELI